MPAKSLSTLVAVTVLLAVVLFLGIEKTPNALVSSEDQSLQRIRSVGVLSVGVDSPYGVMEFYDENGKEAGIDIDIAREFAAQLGVEVRFEAMPFDQLFDAINARRVDIVASAVTITPERQQILRFSEPYLDSGMSRAVSAGNDSIQAHADIEGKKVAVLSGTVGADLAAKSALFGGAEIVSYQSNAERMSDLLAGRVDAAIVHYLSTDDQKIRLVGAPLAQSFYGIVGHLEDNGLMIEINSILRQMKRDGKIRRIRQKYQSGQASAAATAPQT